MPPSRPCPRRGVAHGGARCGAVPIRTLDGPRVGPTSTSVSQCGRPVFTAPDVARAASRLRLCCRWHCLKPAGQGAIGAGASASCRGHLRPLSASLQLPGALSAGCSIRVTTPIPELSIVAAQKSPGWHPCIRPSARCGAAVGRDAACRQWLPAGVGGGSGRPGCVASGLRPAGCQR